MAGKNIWFNQSVKSDIPGLEEYNPSEGKGDKISIKAINMTGTFRINKGGADRSKYNYGPSLKTNISRFYFDTSETQYNRYLVTVKIEKGKAFMHVLYH